LAWKSQWHRHPAVRSGEQLTLGERAADRMRNGMGSWSFIFVFLVLMILWAAANTLLHLGGPSGWDPYPYVLLNLMLSTMAGLQAAALLIAAKRADAIASEIALHTEGNTEDIKKLLAQNTALTQAVEKLTREVHEKVVEMGGKDA